MDFPGAANCIGRFFVGRLDAVSVRCLNVLYAPLLVETAPDRARFQGLDAFGPDLLVRLPAARYGRTLLGKERAGYFDDPADLR